METIRGRRSHDLDLNGLQQQLAEYCHTLIDLGTGDGRFVRGLAAKYPENFFIGIDACRENLRVNSQEKLPNALFIIASAQALPTELSGLASHVSINFPWGSLLESLLHNDIALMGGLSAITRPQASMEIYLNGEALRTAGWTPEAGTDQIEAVLNASGWATRSRAGLDANDLRSLSSTWAKRLAFGRDPGAVHLRFKKGTRS
jgi:16S rRNA (adenine(1408)-N(1))-methyltransferase